MAERLQTNRRLRGRGVSMLYTIVSLLAMVAVISLAVDWGRVQVAKSQLQTAADVSARYAAAGLQNDLNNESASEANARAVLSQNTVDGQAVVFTPEEDLEIGTWNSTGRTFTRTNNLDNANAVRITLRKTRARGSAVPLAFASLIGKSSAEITASSVAFVDFGAAAGLGAGNGRFEYFIPATSNPWLSGMPAGSIANDPNPHANPDYAGSEYVDSGNKKSGNRNVNSSTTNSGDSNWSQWGDYAPKKGSPIRAGGVTVQPGQTITFDGLNGGANNFSSSTLYTADGNLSWITGNINGAENGMSDIRAPINSVVAVFLNDSRPDQQGTAPSTMDFSTDTERDYLTLAPQLRQVFFIGDGRTSSGEVQRITVPIGATRMYIGTMDSYEWNNNVGGFEVTAHEPGRIKTVQ